MTDPLHPALDFSDFFTQLQHSELAPWVDPLQQRINEKLTRLNHGDMPGWLAAFDALPELTSDQTDLDRGSLLIGTEQGCSSDQHQQLEQAMRQLMPWRKGPYSVFGVEIDTEWRSDMKWDRLKDSIAPLHNRNVLDIGCGNGYHCWRMLAAGARRVIGIDPSWKFLLQFRALKKYLGELPVELLPLGIEELPQKMQIFDTVFSMGVFYHRRSPIDHLLELQSFLRPGGELVLETLIIDGDAQQMLLPADRYAQMRNVWFLPSAEALCGWLERCGYQQVRCVDINQTSIEEQRATDWMQYHSLAQFLDPNDPNRTVEGYPAPKRGLFIAQRAY
ncbi:tRNA 5-methoxyuridine(34)/uridine 5-oxyacetic acid(34) synthase CmoB [Motiliproteus coralliicola]|uniref:tRNA U34 carboxymethyltransferase n=1 Tax=Motiliproteus coralliicola TaxID=2283196 RepID=A0A369WQ45_9GAMM|nr:tRNA 5-methoxyuridine(34)/uridine 5-oxyacetic acid(34) synthase CmoB [Motiliproteus coralliicola]RDE22734.1 tRNA 5-methoxyuridine(34)/uridine 5-oxyacetic acid(34) synthase CmoB [Motiliproteus coralliicola]